ncbi:MAG: metallophosphoesterase family protein [Janthinobacterium lividum]
MSLDDSLRIAIATDLHYLKDEFGTVSTQVCAKGTKIDPMNSLIDFLAEPDSPIRPVANMLICPGDITTRACLQSFKHGWNDLRKLKEFLKADELIASTGNHEVSSRGGAQHEQPGNSENAIKPFEHLITTQDYPARFSAAERKWVYWGRGYEVVTGSNWAVVTVNSCHYHNSLLANEYERGRIGDAALEELRAELQNLSAQYDFRLLVLHHPPLPHEDIDVELGRIAMYNGDILLQALENTSQDWMVIHGHKHLFRLVKSPGGDYSPMVLGAASFGAMLDGDLANKTKNQFYIIELTQVEEYGSKRLKCRIESLCWDGVSWALTTSFSQGLPHGCGFDLSNSTKVGPLAGRIREILAAGEVPFRTWDEIADQIDALKYLMPTDILHLHKKLEELGVSRSPKLDSWFPSELWVAK